jgi:RNA 3'-terminal phosphate cyclase (ATP)
MANDVLPDESPSNERMYIPGDFMEGGGQILRNAMAFATLLRRPIRIDKIRGGRKVPGLKPQHATGTSLPSF